MINYFIRPGGAYVKIDTTAEAVDLVLNVSVQKTLSSISNNLDYYNATVSASADWTVSDQITFEDNRNEVLTYLSNR